MGTFSADPDTKITAGLVESVGFSLGVLISTFSRFCNAFNVSPFGPMTAPTFLASTVTDDFFISTAGTAGSVVIAEVVDEGDIMGRVAAFVFLMFSTFAQPST